jgi:hypothetical protein
MSERYIPEHRRTNIKAKGAFKPEELRRRREEQQVEIRKQKRRRTSQRGEVLVAVARPALVLHSALHLTATMREPTPRAQYVCPRSGEMSQKNTR